MDLIKSINDIEPLIKMLEDHSQRITIEDRQRIAHYIRFSAPFKVIKEMERPVFAVLEHCEKSDYCSQLTHDARNALSRLYGYQILQLI